MSPHTFEQGIVLGCLLGWAGSCTFLLLLAWLVNP